MMLSTRAILSFPTSRISHSTSVRLLAGLLPHELNQELTRGQGQHISWLGGGVPGWKCPHLCDSDMLWWVVLAGRVVEAAFRSSEVHLRTLS
jgi:hypothetical protein